MERPDPDLAGPRQLLIERLDDLPQAQPDLGPVRGDGPGGPFVRASCGGAFEVDQGVTPTPTPTPVAPRVP